MVHRRQQHRQKHGHGLITVWHVVSISVIFLPCRVKNLPWQKLKSKHFTLKRRKNRKNAATRRKNTKITANRWKFYPTGKAKKHWYRYHQLSVVTAAVIARHRFVVVKVDRGTSWISLAMFIWDVFPAHAYTSPHARDNTELRSEGPKLDCYRSAVTKRGCQSSLLHVDRATSLISSGYYRES